MKSLLTIFSWVIFAVICLSGYMSWDWGLFFLGFIWAIVIKIVLNDNYIKNSVDDFKREIFDEILLKLKDQWVKIPQNVEEKIKKETTSVQVPLESLKKLEQSEQLDEITSDSESTFVTESLLVEKADLGDGDYKFETEQIQEVKKEIKEEKEDSKFVIFLKDFFSENIVAKIWWILLALWVLFLMWLIYTYVWPVTKIILWFILWFLVYVLWIILERKWFKQEAMILIWSWILINYIVILSWKYLIWDWDNWETWILSSFITFIFLILNTILSVITSFVYKSKSLLLFSLIFSYTIPFLIWNKYSNLFIVSYSLILSLWGFIISHYYKDLDHNSSAIIQFIALIWWNILLCTSWFSTGIEFAITMFWFIVINFVSIFLFYKSNFILEIKNNFLLSYIFLWIIMIFWKSIAWFSGLVFFLISTIWLFIFNSFLIANSIITSMFFLLFFPLILAFGFLVLWDVHSWFIILPTFLIAFLTSFVFLLSTKLNTVFKNIFFIMLAIFLILWNWFTLYSLWKLDVYTFYSIFVTWIIFLISSYFLSNKKDLSYLYTIWTLWAIAIFSPIIRIIWEFAIPSALMVIVFFISNILTPYFNKNLVKNDTINLILWNVFWILFVGFNLFIFWLQYFPWVSLGLSFMFLALIYFFWWFNLFSKIEKAWYDEHKSKMNFVNTLLTIAITLFTISVAIIFSGIEIVIALIWLAESSVILFFASKTNSNNLWIIWNILFAIWVFKFGTLFSHSLSLKDLVWISFITLVLFFNYIKIVFDSQLKIKWLVRVLHAIWLIFVYFYTIYIFEIHETSMLLIYSFVFVWFISFIYSQLKDNLFKNISLWLFVFFLVFHISVAYISKSDELYYLNFVITFLASLIIFVHYKIFNLKNIIFLIIFYSYLFIISSIYLYHFTDDFFSLTIYWGIISLFAVHFWIYKNQKYVRSIWIWVLSLTLFKILLYDIWSWTDNSIIRIVAFLLTWWIAIYISSLYKKHNLKIKDDLNISLSSNETNDETKLTQEKSSQEDTQEKELEKNSEVKQESNWRANIELEKINIWDKKAIIISYKDWKKATIKSKNLIKIWVLIKKIKWKSDFEKDELKDIYLKIKNNYKAEFPKRDYDKVIELLDKFVEEWWSFEFI